MKPNPDEVRVILHAPCPSHIKEVLNFVGYFLNYSRFIPNFIGAFALSYAFLKKNVKYAWGNDYQVCFEATKNIFKGIQIMILFNPNATTAIETDISNKGIAAARVPKHTEAFMPVQFDFKLIDTAQKSYFIRDKEALAGMFAIEWIREYILGSKFQVRTNTKPLLNLFGLKTLWHSIVVKDCIYGTCD